MASDATALSGDASTVLDHWSARKVQPIVMLYVVAVFVVFIALSVFIFHSPEALKALVIAAVGGVAATAPGVLEKVEYRMTGSGIEKRTVNAKKPRPFKDVFRWDELSRVSRMKHGFRYDKTMPEASRLRRFWKKHISDGYSGEIHVERGDLDRVLAIVGRQGIAIS